MPRRFLLLFFLGGLSLLPARANLGETVAQLVARYGKPDGYAEANATSPFGKILFRAGGFELVIFLSDTVEVGARVSKINKSPLDASEIATIMNADTNGSPWVSTPAADPSTLQWTRSDQATVMYDKDKRMLIFTSPAMAQRLAAPVAPAGAPPPAAGTPGPAKP